MSSPSTKTADVVRAVLVLCHEIQPPFFHCDVLVAVVEAFTAQERGRSWEDARCSYEEALATVASVFHAAIQRNRTNDIPGIGPLMVELFADFFPPIRL